MGPGPRGLRPPDPSDLDKKMKFRKKIRPSIPWSSACFYYSPAIGKINYPISRPRIEGNNLIFTGFEIPFKDIKDGMKTMNLIDDFLGNSSGRVLVDYFLESPDTFKEEFDQLSYSERVRLFQIIVSLDSNYLLSNRMTSRLYNKDRRFFESIVRQSLENENLEPKEGSKQNISYFQCGFWSKPIILNYNPGKGFQAEDSSDFERFSFLEDVLNRFFNEKKEVFKKLKNDINLTYSLKINLGNESFDCCLEEQSVIKEAYKLNKDLERLVDEPKTLAYKIDSFTEIVNEILSKTGVENIEDVLPLYEHTKRINEFKFSEGGIQAYFFAHTEYKPSDYFCIFLSKDGQCFKASHRQGGIEYVNGNSVEYMLRFLQSKHWISFDSLNVKKELEKIEFEAFKEQGIWEDMKDVAALPPWPIFYKDGLERILKLKELKLPERWFKLRDLHEHQMLESKEAILFIFQVRSSDLLNDLVEYLRNMEVDK